MLISMFGVSSSSVLHLLPGSTSPWTRPPGHVPLDTSPWTRPPELNVALSSAPTRTDAGSPNNIGWSAASVAAVGIFISVQENDEWNVQRSLQTRAPGEALEKELSDERARDIKRTLSGLRVVRGGGRRAGPASTATGRSAG